MTGPRGAPPPGWRPRRHPATVSAASCSGQPQPSHQPRGDDQPEADQQDGQAAPGSLHAHFFADGTSLVYPRPPRSVPCPRAAPTLSIYRTMQRSLALVITKLRRSLYARPAIVRGQQCAEGAADPTQSSVSPTAFAVPREQPSPTSCAGCQAAARKRIRAWLATTATRSGPSTAGSWRSMLKEFRGIG